MVASNVSEGIEAIHALSFVAIRGSSKVWHCDIDETAVILSHESNIALLPSQVFSLRSNYFFRICGLQVVGCCYDTGYGPRYWGRSVLLVTQRFLKLS